MYDNDNIFMFILDMCGNLNVDELKGLIANIEIMIENLESEEEMKLALIILLFISVLSFAIFNIIEIVCSIKFYKRIQRENDELIDYLIKNSRKGDK